MLANGTFSKFIISTYHYHTKQMRISVNCGASGMIECAFYYESSKYEVQVYVPVKKKFEKATADHRGANGI